MSVEEAISCPSADIISSMPKDLKLHILGLLPMKGAAMSSALSTQWRDMWTYLPSLVFQGPEMKLTSDHICGVLRRHRGPLREFSLLLSHNSEENRGFVPARARQNHVERDIESVISVFGSNILDSLITIDEILNLLPSQTLTSLVIDYFNSTIGDRTLLMRMAMILLFSDLKTLRLSYCLLSDSVPVSFDRRFEKLTVLELRDVEFPPNSPQWKFGCPMLTTLTLDGCTCMHSSMETPAIVIEEAPKLSYFYIDGVFVSLQFNGSTPLLKQVFIRKVRLTWTVESKLLKVNGALAAVESLSVAKYFYEYLAADRYIECKDTPWENLRNLRLDDVRLRAKGHARAVLRMITSSPNLQRLTILMDGLYSAVVTRNSKDDEALEMMKSGGDAAGSGLELLKRIEMKGARGSEDELSLISWLLNSAPALEQMEIQVTPAFVSRDEYPEIVKTVNGFPRASSQVEIHVTTPAVFLSLFS